jgi:HTH-type transcriptional regulator/antitoxin HigA
VADYQAALEEIQSLFDAAPNTPQGDKLEVLATVVEAYEEKQYPIPAPDPIEAVRYFMESRGLTRKDLEPYIGNRARVSEVLNRKRPLTLRMIQRLHNTLGIPADMLLKPYPVSRRLANKALPRTAQPRSTSARTGG